MQLGVGLLVMSPAPPIAKVVTSVVSTVSRSACPLSASTATASTTGTGTGTVVCQDGCDAALLAITENVGPGKPRVGGEEDVDDPPGTGEQLHERVVVWHLDDPRIQRCCAKRVHQHCIPT